MTRDGNAVSRTTTPPTRKKVGEKVLCFFVGYLLV